MGTFTIGTNHQLMNAFIGKISAKVNSNGFDGKVELREGYSILDELTGKNRSVLINIGRGRDIELGLFDTSEDRNIMLSSIQSDVNELQFADMNMAAHVAKFSLNQFDDATMCVVNWLSGDTWHPVN